MIARLIALTITAAVALGVAGSANAAKPPKPPWIVKDLGGARGHAIVAGWSSKRKNQNLQSLISKWGKPTRCSLRRYRGKTIKTNGTATWKKPAVRVEIANYGRYAPKGKTLCTHPASGKVQFIETVGSKWTTDRGLRVGALSTVAYDLYPGAEWDNYEGGFQESDYVIILRPVWRDASQTIDGEASWTGTVRARPELGWMPWTKCCAVAPIDRFEIFVGAAGE